MRRLSTPITCLNRLVSYTSHTLLQSVKKHYESLNMRIRSKVDILASILQMANGGAKRSKMTMNNYHLLRHISLLCENDLLQYDKKENVLRTTPKGIEFLTAYNELVECCHKEEGSSLHNWGLS